MPTTQKPTSARPKKKQRTTHVPVMDLAREAVLGALSKKADDVVVLDMRSVGGVADCFMVCSGDTDRQVKAIADAVREQVREAHGERPWHVEGNNHYKWVLLDYVDLVVHIFDPEKRAFYDLERLWNDAPRFEVDSEASEEDVAALFADLPARDASTS